MTRGLQTCTQMPINGDLEQMIWRQLYGCTTTDYVLQTSIKDDLEEMIWGLLYMVAPLLTTSRFVLQTCTYQQMSMKDDFEENGLEDTDSFY